MPKSYNPYLTDLETGEDLRYIPETDIPTREEEGSSESDKLSPDHGVVSKNSNYYKYEVRRVTNK